MRCLLLMVAYRFSITAADDTGVEHIERTLCEAIHQQSNRTPEQIVTELRAYNVEDMPRAIGLTINALRTSEMLAKELLPYVDSEQQRISIKLLPSQRKLYEEIELDFYEAQSSRKPSLMHRYNRQLHSSVPHLHSVVQLVHI